MLNAERRRRTNSLGFYSRNKFWIGPQEASGIKKRKIEKLREETKNSCIAGVYYDEDKGHYVRWYFSDYGPTKFYKKLSNKRIRMKKGEDIGNHSTYKRMYDIKWEIL